MTVTARHIRAAADLEVITQAQAARIVELENQLEEFRKLVDEMLDAVKQKDKEATILTNWARLNMQEHYQLIVDLQARYPDDAELLEQLTKVTRRGTGPLGGAKG